MKVLVIGGNGYIGSYLVPFLRSADLDVSSYGNRSGEDYNNLTAEFLAEFDQIVLLAGHSSVQMCNGPLSSPWLNNVVNFKNLLSKTKQSHNIIYASSASVYGCTVDRTSTEDDISLDFINNYDHTKVCLDLYASQQINKGRSIIGLRFGTVNGGSSVIRRDLMINSMVHSALKYGVINVNNKHVSRPILYIEDLSRAILKILTSWYFFPGLYNLASFNSNVDTISKIVQQHTGVVINDRGDSSGVYDFSISPDKFKRTYNFVYGGTIDKVITDVIECYNQDRCKVVTRNEYFDYKHND